MKNVLGSEMVEREELRRIKSAINENLIYVNL